MVAPADFLAEMAAAGVRFRVEGGRLVADAPVGAVTPERSAYVRRQKAALVAVLGGGRAEELTYMTALAEMIADRRRWLIDDGGNPLCPGCGRVARRDGTHGCPACDGEPTGPAGRWA